MASFTLRELTAPEQGGWKGSGLLQPNPNWLIPLPQTVHLNNTSLFVRSSTGTRPYSTLLFEITDNVFPKYFAVCYPEGLTSFSHANLFFHPNPGGSRPPYDDGQYSYDRQKWPELFRYMHIIGPSLVASGRSQCVIMPYMRQTMSHDVGVLKGHWLEVLTLLLQTAASAAPGATQDEELTDLVISSFSFGIRYSDTARKQMARVMNYLAEVWDFDGIWSKTDGHLSKTLTTNKNFKVIKYGQIASPGYTSIARDRWKDFGVPPDIHQTAVGSFWLNACIRSGVG
jgi:hypothetical protein